MKKLDRLIISTFVGPFVATFFIMLFILVMQFVWKYIDDLAGKDLDSLLILQLLFYTSASMVPLALPLATLLSSIMTMGSLGENHETVAMKAAGISLYRFMMPMVVAGIFISVGAFFFSNYVIPVANLKAGTLLYDMQAQRPALNIKEGVFYKGIDGFSIKIGKKDKDGKTIHDILIYDHRSGRGSDNMMTAKDGEMFMTADKRFLTLNLKNGYHYEELAPKQNGDNELMRTGFATYNKLFDLSAFSLTRSNESMYKDHYQMLNLKQLHRTIDSMTNQRDTIKKTVHGYLDRYYHIKSIPVKATASARGANFFDQFNKAEKKRIYAQALIRAREIRGYTTMGLNDLDYNKTLISRHKIEVQRKYTLSVACLLLLLIGAPLGAIIRKGGLGLPVVMSVIFFVIFHSSGMIGEKMAREFVLTPFGGMWLQIFVITPIAVFLIYKAKNDSALFNLDVYKQYFQRVIKLFAKNDSGLK